MKRRQCGNIQCRRTFSDPNELKLHNIVIHKARIRRKSTCMLQCETIKKNQYIEKIKNLFTSETKKLDQKSPPIQSIYLDPYMCSISSDNNRRTPSPKSETRSSRSSRSSRSTMSSSSESGSELCYDTDKQTK
jgi:hypothetical protein